MGTHDAPEAQANQLTWYMVGQGSWFTSLGLQFVLFPFLVTFVLEVSPALVGIAQMSLSLPAILFMLLGGATADRGDPRTILFRIHLLAAVPPLALASTMNAGLLNYEMLIAYGLVMGTATAFAMPARDATLSRVAGDNIQRGVTLALAIQQTSQLLGMLMALAAYVVGAPLLFAWQSLIMLAGGIASRQLPKKPDNGAVVHAPRARAMWDGLAYVRKSVVILPVVIAMFAVGVFYIGAFLVILPLIVRDFYGGGIIEIGIANIAFWGATIISTVALLRVGHVARRGRGAIIALGVGVLVVFAFSFEMPFWLFCVFSFIWGLGAGCVMTLSRTIVQAEADEAYRARALSIFQLGFAGGSPLGSLIMGVLAGLVGTHMAMWVPTLGMTLVLAWLMMKSRLWTLHAHDAS